MDRWMNKYVKLMCTESLNGLRWSERLTSASHWYHRLKWCDTSPSRSLLSLFLSLWEFSDPVCSSTRQQQSYFYILTGDNTLSSARPPLICMLPPAVLLPHLCCSHPFLLYHPMLLLPLFYICLHWLWSSIFLLGCKCSSTHWFVWYKMAGLMGWYYYNVLNCYFKINNF